MSATMVVLLCFFLALLTSPFKSKSWRESRECRAPTSADRAAAQGARSRPPHEQRSPVLPAVSLVSVAAQAITIGAKGVPVAWAPALGDPWFSFSPSYGSCNSTTVARCGLGWGFERVGGSQSLLYLKMF